MSDLSRSATRVHGFDDPEMDFQLMRQLGAASYGGASVGQSLALAAHIGDKGASAWVEAFAASARSMEVDAEARAQAGHAVSARDMFLMACNAYRAAEYYSPVRTLDHRRLGKKSRDCFTRACAFMPHELEEIFVEHRGLRLPAYLFTPPDASKPNRTLAVVSGFDGTLEESWLQIGRGALERGWSVFLFAGPGQMDTLRFNDPTRLEPDYEAPLGAAFDHLLERPGIDPQRLALYGVSFGGYFASRTASRDDRVKALVANSPIVDLASYMCGFVGFDPVEDMQPQENFTREDMAHIPDDVFPPEKKKQAENLMDRFGQETFVDVFRYMRQFAMGGEIADIRCPALALAGTGEGHEVARQMDIFCRGVGGPVASRTFTQAEGADSHCQVGNLPLANAVIMDWLDETLD